MRETAFLDCPERVEFSDECYGVFGRALYVAQQFESKCKSLAMLCTIKKAHRTGELGDLNSPEFREFVSALWERQLATNIKALKAYGLPGKIRRILHRAQAARNDIAHNIGHGSEHNIETYAGRTELIKHVKKLVLSIAKGDQLISLLIQVATNEPLPTSVYLNSYPDIVVKWVCETFD